METIELKLGEVPQVLLLLVNLSSHRNLLLHANDLQDINHGMRTC